MPNRLLNGTSFLRPPNGLELSRPTARGHSAPFSRYLAGKAPSRFSPARRVGSSELLDGRPVWWAPGNGDSLARREGYGEAMTLTRIVSVNA